MQGSATIPENRSEADVTSICCMELGSEFKRYHSVGTGPLGIANVPSLLSSFSLLFLLLLMFPTFLSNSLTTSFWIL